MSDRLKISDIWMGDTPDGQEDQHGGEVAVSAQDFNEVAVNIVSDNDAACSIYLTVVEAVTLSERQNLATKLATSRFRLVRLSGYGSARV